MEWIGVEGGVAGAGTTAIGLFGPENTSQWGNLPIVGYDTDGTTAEDIAPGYIVRTMFDIAFESAEVTTGTAVFRWVVMYIDLVQLFDVSEVTPLGSDELGSDSVLSHGIEQVNVDSQVIVSSGSHGMECDAQVTREADDKSGLVFLLDGPSGIVNLDFMGRVLLADESESGRL